MGNVLREYGLFILVIYILTLVFLYLIIALIFLMLLFLYALFSDPLSCDSGSESESEDKREELPKKDKGKKRAEYDINQLQDVNTLSSQEQDQKDFEKNMAEAVRLSLQNEKYGESSCDPNISPTQKPEQFGDEEEKQFEEDTAEAIRLSLQNEESGESSRITEKPVTNPESNSNLLSKKRALENHDSAVTGSESGSTSYVEPNKRPDRFGLESSDNINESEGDGSGSEYSFYSSIRDSDFEEENKDRLTKKLEVLDAEDKLKRKPDTSNEPSEKKSQELSKKKLDELPEKKTE